MSAWFCVLCKRIGRAPVCAYCGTPCDEVHLDV